MPFGIDPKVDFAFKLVFGGPDHPRITIHFLNSVLRPPRPITSVEILNPIQERDRSDAKLAILDVLAQDADDRRYNIEMQTTLPVDLRSRLTYYNCLNYVRQLSSGNPYHQLRPAISICVLDRLLFGDVPDYHLSFRLRCDQRDLVFTDDLLFHTLELPKYVVLGDNTLCDLPGVEQWFCFLKLAEQRDVHELANLLGDSVFEEAAGVLEMIFQSPEDRQFYEARMKFLHDEEARLIAAREEGMEKGREEGAAQGTLVGKIQILQEIIGDSVTSTRDQHARPATARFGRTIQAVIGVAGTPSFARRMTFSSPRARRR
ncbi:MAG: hypothetical protein CMJ64_25195 [Planctomycetaceae bacterium]|jgi:predicted transposase/invertase (TIGR01784 family)|nr:hypothetical protein [Planctomycetaceae bacterium]